MLQQSSTHLPLPDAAAKAFSDRLKALIQSEIEAQGGWISFARYMELALFSPAQGYYTGGAHKFGRDGDFITAPELTPLFAQALAQQAVQVMALSSPHLIEVGAGSGRLAADMLAELERLGALPREYGILELSGELRARQQATIAATVPHLLDRVRWLDALPEQFDGLVVANELLDAMPVHLVVWGGGQVLERGVAIENGEFVWIDRPAPDAVTAYAQHLAREVEISEGYLSEINLAARAWVASWAQRLGRGALLLIDYGFPRHEYYHPQRSEGTLMCHYRHHAHGDPFFLPGLQDITAHVDFTSIIESGFEAGLSLLGYANQATFLMGCGLDQLLARVPHDNHQYLKTAQAVQKLVSPAEMGDLFKVMVLGKNVEEGLVGFRYGDRSHTL